MHTLKLEHDDLHRKIDIALKIIDSTAHSKEAKEREINEAVMRTSSLRQEVLSIKDEIAVRTNEISAVKRERLSVMASSKVLDDAIAEAEADREKAEHEKILLKVKIEDTIKTSNAAKMQNTCMHREVDVLRQQRIVFLRREKEKVDATTVLKNLTEIQSGQRRALEVDIGTYKRTIGHQTFQVMVLFIVNLLQLITTK